MKASPSISFLTGALLSLLLPCQLISNPFSNTFFIAYSGYWLPLDGRLGHDWTPGPSFGAGIGFQLNDRIALIGSTSYTQFRYIGGLNLTVDEFSSILEVDETKRSICSIFEFKYTPNQSNGLLHPYIKSGIGFYFESASTMKITVGRVDSSEIFTRTVDSPGELSDGLFLSYTIGTDLSFSKNFIPFLEGRIVFDRSELEVSYLPIIAGIRF